MFGEKTVQLAGGNAGDFKVKIAGLPFENQVSHASADEPEPAACLANEAFNLAEGRNERGVFKAEANGQSRLQV
ncbi:MAG: hypothetical protein LZF86_190038 [Nitrospira sp.]|nr:MAG: hypothetical protein LZF86_190038 [Nitrospira sp.]